METPETSNKPLSDVNQEFYTAFNKKDLDAMQQIWSKGTDIICLHPGWPILKGHADIIKSWQDIFKNTDFMEIKLSDVQIVEHPNMAWVHCQENLFSMHEEGIQQSAVLATNLYQKEKGAWKIILHHASAFSSK